MLTFEMRRTARGGGIAGIKRRMSQAAQEGVNRAAQSTYAVVVSKAKGQLASCIRFEVVNIPERCVKAARVFNDTGQIPWSSYVEFGTGLYVEDQGNREAIRLKRAKQIPWYIHVSMVPASFERYEMCIRDSRQGVSEGISAAVGDHYEPTESKGGRL